MDLMLDKIVKAFFRQHKHPMKNRAGRVAFVSGKLNVSAQALTFSPSIISYAGWQGADSEVAIEHSVEISSLRGWMRASLSNLLIWLALIYNNLSPQPILEERGALDGEVSFIEISLC